MAEFIFDWLAVTALFLSIVGFMERWRGSQRAREEGNILNLSSQISEIYNMVDDNLAEVLESRGAVKLKKGNDRARFLILQKLHIHLDTLQMMIKLESSTFRNVIFSKYRNEYYRELIEWYCSVHKLYNDLLDLFEVEDSSYLHDGLRDPHRTKNQPPLFLSNDKYAKRYHALRPELLEDK
ncbi:MAG: hypothetical protein HY833_01945 [Candidatus Aenigmarchaeota archaeon]|nr:hypothetical protein [Candidatus Aenigmarchaeota archaeon]